MMIGSQSDAGVDVERPDLDGPAASSTVESEIASR